MRNFVKYIGFPAFASRRTRTLTYGSMATVWPAAIATIWIQRDDPGAWVILAAILVGLALTASAGVSLMLEYRRWLRECQ